MLCGEQASTSGTYPECLNTASTMTRPSEAMPSLDRATLTAHAAETGMPARPSLTLGRRTGPCWRIPHNKNQKDPKLKNKPIKARCQGPEERDTAQSRWHKRHLEPQVRRETGSQGCRRGNHGCPSRSRGSVAVQASVFTPPGKSVKRSGWSLGLGAYAVGAFEIVTRSRIGHFNWHHSQPPHAYPGSPGYVSVDRNHPNWNLCF